MKFETQNIDSQQKVGIKYEYYIPNPKYHEGIYLDKIYILFHSEKHGILDMENSKNIRSLNSLFTDTNKNYLDNSTDNMVFFTTFIYSTEPNYDSTKCFRMAYEYEENGQVKYTYSPTFKAAYNDLK